MKQLVIFASLLLVLFINKTKAQDKDNNSEQVKQFSIFQPSDIIEYLHPVTIGTEHMSGSKEITRLFSLDVAKTREILPELVRTATVWKLRGKNDHYAIHELTIDLQQLVPILIGAMQQQMTRITELEKKIALLQVHYKDNEKQEPQVK
jgi:hypothetical protein